MTTVSTIFGSKTKAQEILFLLKDAKKVVRQGFYEKELTQIEEFCEQQNLHLVKSKFKVLLADEQAYSNKGIRVEPTDYREGMYFVYISKNERSAWLASYYELVNNTEELGKILGYPACCVNFFCKRFTADNPNLQLTATNPLTNLTKRKEDCVILSHFPCSSECEGSISLAKRYLEVISEENLARATEMLELLKV